MRGVGYVAFSSRPVAEWIDAEPLLFAEYALSSDAERCSSPAIPNQIRRLAPN
jgi:hypothetical protein